MVKRISKTAGLIVLLLIGLYIPARFLDVSLGGIYDAARAPYLQMAGPDSIIIHWQTARPQIGVVRIGKKPNQVLNVFKESRADDEHRIKITGLQPGTRYYYSVGTRYYSIYQGEDYWFKTSPGVDNSRLAKNKPVTRFWVTGDQGLAGDIQNQVRDAMLSWIKAQPLKTDSGKKVNPDFWLTTGDNAYRSGSNQQFQDNFFTPYASILKHTPVWPVYGNHDARRRVFFNIFSFPTRAELGGFPSATEKYYSFDYANVHVVVLDSQSSRIQKNSRMLRWLKKDLALTKLPWLIAVFHHPPYSKGTHNSDNPADSFNRMQNIRRYVLPVLEKAGVDVVLSGHSHMYERSWFMRCHYGNSDSFGIKNILDRKPQGSFGSMENRLQQIAQSYRKAASGLSANAGTVYITLGSSAKLDEGELNHVAMPVSLGKAGSMIFDVVGNKLSANFITESGEIADSFTIVKGVSDAPETFAGCKD